jgi:hypothetical protein
MRFLLFSDFISFYLGEHTRYMWEVQLDDVNWYRNFYPSQMSNVVRTHPSYYFPIINCHITMTSTLLSAIYRMENTLTYFAGNPLSMAHFVNKWVI